MGKKKVDYHQPSKKKPPKKYNPPPPLKIEKKGLGKAHKKKNVIGEGELASGNSLRRLQGVTRKNTPKADDERRSITMEGDFTEGVAGRGGGEPHVPISNKKKNSHF